MNSETITPTVKLKPVSRNDLPAVAEFLHNHMNNQFPASVWQQGVSKNWLDDAPNHGFMLEHDNEIVGVLCAIYSQHYVNGVWEKFCNPHSWCVLPDYRKRSIDLVMAVIRQPGFHFTMFTPNKEGIEIFSFLRFKPLDNTVAIVLNIPALRVFSNVKIITNLDRALELLPDQAARCLSDHRDYPWLQFLTFGEKNNYGFIIFKQKRYKRVPCALIMYISDFALFRRCWPKLRSHLLFRHGMFTTKIEARLIKESVGTISWNEPGLRKFYLSATLGADDIENIYSEQVTLDL